MSPDRWFGIPLSSPRLLLPAKGRFGLTDYDKIFCAEPAPGRDIFEMRGIDRDRGCLVIVRPDQYVAHNALAGFFDGILQAPAGAPLSPAASSTGTAG